MQHGEECTGLDELTRAPERILIDCFRALDGGATSDDCFARYPQQADSLRGVLDMRAQLLTLRTTAPSPTTFASGREALLARVVRPLASSHPGSMETQGRQARGSMWRPATRAAFAGVLLFAMTSCAIGVSATPAGDKIGEALPAIPTIDVPEQRPPYPFPEYNGASPDVLPTNEPAAPSNSEPIETAPQPSEPSQDAPIAEDSDAQDNVDPAHISPQADPSTGPANPGDTWLPPINAHEDDPPEVDTPEPSSDDADGSDHDSNNVDESNGQDDGDENASDDDADDDDDGSDDHEDSHKKDSDEEASSDG